MGFRSRLFGTDSKTKSPNLNPMLTLKITAIKRFSWMDHNVLTLAMSSKVDRRRES
jgi:hypothetical protein